MKKTTRPNSNNSVSDTTLSAIRRASREIHKQMPAGGRHGSKKGKRGYVRKPKHQKTKDQPDGE